MFNRPKKTIKGEKLISVSVPVETIAQKNVIGIKWKTLIKMGLESRDEKLEYNQLLEEQRRTIENLRSSVSGLNARIFSLESGGKE